MNTQYTDAVWLKTFHLRKENVLDYFSTSPFFDPTSNNQILNTQGISSEHLLGMTGLEYSIDAENTVEPHLYVIQKAYRRSPTTSETIEIYYCVNGVIYQSPFFLELLRTRVSKAAFNVLQAFDETVSRMVYDSTGGYRIGEAEEGNRSYSSESSNSVPTQDRELRPGAASSSSISKSASREAHVNKAAVNNPAYNFKHVFTDIEEKF